MSINKRSQGKYFENQVERYLKAHGYRTVRRNFYYRSSEIDLIMLSPEEVLVFVEVKYRHLDLDDHMRNEKNKDNFHPWKSISYRKQQSLFRGAAGFLNENPSYADHYSRYDVVIVTSSSKGETQIEHFQEAFREGDPMI